MELRVGAWCCSVIMRESLSGSIVNLGITRKLQFRANYLKIRVRFQKIDCDRRQMPADVPKPLLLSAFGSEIRPFGMRGWPGCRADFEGDVLESLDGSEGLDDLADLERAHQDYAGRYRVTSFERAVCFQSLVGSGRDSAIDLVRFNAAIAGLTIEIYYSCEWEEGGLSRKCCGVRLLECCDFSRGWEIGRAHV